MLLEETMNSREMYTEITQMIVEELLDETNEENQVEIWCWCACPSPDPADQYNLFRPIGDPLGPKWYILWVPAVREQFITGDVN